MDYVCEEIVIEILTRLPVKSLVRFMGVCRLWKSIITSPRFRLEVSKRPAKLLVHTDQECYLVEDDDEDENLVRLETTDFPFKHLLRQAFVVGSDNGLVCFCNYTPNWGGGIPGRIIIWNPSIRKHAVIPMNPVSERPTFFQAHGFGATISGSDYKYVGVLPFVRYLGNEATRNLAVEIYSWKIGTWGRIYLDMDLYRNKTISRQCASLRGRLHWMVLDQSSLNINSILSFDLEDEVFEDIMLPACVSSSRSCRYRVNVYEMKGSLAVIVDEEEPNRIMHCSVWMMQEYGDVNSWTKLCRVDLTTMIGVDWALQIKEKLYLTIQSTMVRLLKNGELLLRLGVVAGFLSKVRPPKLVKYNPKTRKGTDVICGLSKLGEFNNCFKESLVFLTHDHRVVADHEVLSGPARPVLKACEARINTNITRKTKWFCCI